MAQRLQFTYDIFRGMCSLPDNDLGLLFRSVGEFIYEGKEIKLPEKLLGAYYMIKPYIDDDIERHKKYIESKSGNGKLGGRPKKDWDNSQKAKKAKKAKKATDNDNDNIIIFISNKEDILNIIKEEEISKIRNELNILFKMIKMGYKLEKKEECVYEFVDWLKDMVKQFVPLRENGNIDWGEVMKLVDGWVEYWKVPPKDKKYPTNFRSSLRTNFSIFTKPKNG